MSLGLRTFSMQPSACLEVKDMIRRTRCRPLARLARRLLCATDPLAQQQLLAQLNQAGSV